MSELPANHDEIAAQLEAFLARSPALNQYLLLDCYLGNPMADLLAYYKIAEDAQVRIPVVTKKGGERDPLLIQIEPETQPLMRDALDFALLEASDSCFGARHVCAWLLSDKPINRVAWTLRKNGRQHLSGQPPGTVSFRYFDPRVIHTLRRILKPIQLSGLFDPIISWGYIDYRTTFSVLDNPDPKVSHYFGLRPAQEQTLLRNAALQKSLDLLRKYRADWHEETDVEILGYLEQAASERLRDEENQAAYAAYRWLMTNLRAYPTLLETALRAYRDDGVPLEAKIDSLSPGLFAA
jgi:hypothetical protein